MTFGRRKISTRDIYEAQRLQSVLERLAREESVTDATPDGPDLSALYAAPRIHSYDDGTGDIRHRDAAGREYRAVEVEGETTYVPMEEPVTETTARPDPQVVAWMRDYLREHPDVSMYAAVSVGVRAFMTNPAITSATVADAYEAARRPLTVADIPAGQGAASLAVVGDTVYYREADGHLRSMLSKPMPQAVAQTALWEHLATTLPPVTDDTEEEA